MLQESNCHLRIVPLKKRPFKNKRDKDISCQQKLSSPHADPHLKKLLKDVFQQEETKPRQKI